MKKIFKLMLILAFAFCCLAGCENADDKQAENVPAVPQPVELADLQPGESVEIAVTPELREYYFALGRLEGWFYLPEFSSPAELPTDPLWYWFMMMAEGRTGWDRYGNLTGPSPWLHKGYLDIESRFEIYGIDENGQMWDNDTAGIYMGLSVTEFDDWVAAHFGAVSLEHEIHDDSWHGKNYYFDGENYYFTCMEGVCGLSYYGLQSLQAERAQDGRLIYTAMVDWYRFNEYGLFFYDENGTLEENMGYFAQCVEGYPENRALYDAYGERLIHGEIGADEAIRQMIIDGDTQNFEVGYQLQVKYYLNEETGEPFYLQVIEFER